MAMHTKNQTIKIEGMTCPACENRIRHKLSKTPGVEHAEISYVNGTGSITYNSSLLRLEDIEKTIESCGYQIGDSQGYRRAVRISGIFFILIAAYLILQRTGLSGIFNFFPQAESSMGYGMIFVTGLLTSVHCIAMCGGINLSQSLSGTGEANSTSKWQPLKNTLFYNGGRVFSYTIIGAIAGSLGSIISFSSHAKGLVQFLAGIFMILMGINMLGLFPGLRRLTAGFRLKLPQFVLPFNLRYGPIVTGLFNGLMPCGPLQAMQLYALSTASPVKGALAMFVFGMGTAPLMFSLGAASAFMKEKSARIMEVGAVLVVVLGISMSGRGLSLWGVGVSQLAPVSADSGNAAIVDNGIQLVNTKLLSRSYTPIEVTKDIPVRWTISAEEGTINGCNNTIIIPEFGLEKRLYTGDNIIEFTPSRSGSFIYTCWMGMISSTITVAEADGSIADVTDDPYTGSYTAPPLFRPSSSNMTLATQEGDMQKAEISLEDNGPASGVIIMAYGIETDLTFIENGSGIESLIFPVYYAQLDLSPGENTVYFTPTEDFNIVSPDGEHVLYVKVVGNMESINTDAIKREIGALPEFSEGAWYLY